MLITAPPDPAPNLFLQFGPWTYSNFANALLKLHLIIPPEWIYVLINPLLPDHQKVSPSYCTD